MDVREVKSAIPLNPSAELRSTERGMTGAAGGDRGAFARSDHADVSVTAALLADAAGQPEVREERVSALQQQLSQGTYNVSSRSVADALLRGLGRG